MQCALPYYIVIYKCYIFWVRVGTLRYTACNAHYRITLLSVACPAQQYFSTLSHEWHGFCSKCVFWFSLQLLSETFLILRRTERDPIKKKSSGLPVTCPIYSCPILVKPEFSQLIFEFIKFIICQIPMKSV